MPDPIQPTAVFPAGWPLPGRSTAVGTPPPVPPVWPPYTPPPAPPPPPVPVPRQPTDITVSVETIRIEVTLTHPEPDPPTWAERLQLWRNLRCCAAAFVPASVWATALHECWKQGGIDGAWVLASAAIGITAAYDQRRRGRAPATPGDRGRGTWLTRTLLCTALIAPTMGLPIVRTIAYIVTGVTP